MKTFIILLFIALTALFVGSYVVDAETELPVENEVVLTVDDIYIEIPEEFIEEEVDWVDSWVEEYHDLAVEILEAYPDASVEELDEMMSSLLEV